MGLDARHHGRSLPDSRPYTLPSVAELLSSSRLPAVDPAYHRMPDSTSLAASHRHPSTSRSPANPPAAVQRAWTPVNHVSPHVSPTDTTVPAIAAEPPLDFAQDSRPTALPFISIATSEASPSVTDVEHPPRPINSQRQDSAISQQRIRTLKEAGPLPPSSDTTFSASTPRLDQPPPSISATPSSQPSKPTANPIPATGERLPTVAFSQPDSQPSQQTLSKSLSLGGQVSADSFRTQERMASLAGPVRSDPAPKAAAPVSSLETANNTTRQQRYNVRFIANYTSENMPLSQKSRNDTSAALPTPVEVTEPNTASPEQPLTPSVELSVPHAVPVAQSAEEQLQVQQRRRDPSVERCLGCNEPWKRPLPNTDLYRHSSPAENNNDLSKISMNMIAQLVDHRKKADAMYERWRWRHSHCLPQADDDLRPLTPPALEPQLDSHASNGDDAPHNSKSSDAPSNKRKSENSHEDEQESNPKVRRVTFDALSSTPPLRPLRPAPA